MKTKRLTRARKEAQGTKVPTQSNYEMRRASRRGLDTETPDQVSAR